MILARRLSLLSLTLGVALAPPGARPSKADEPTGKPVVVLVGDSIRMGYAPFVAERLKGVAEVVSPEENGGDSGNVLKHLDEWVITRTPAVVYFNAGLHDLKTDPKTGARQVGLDQYRKNLAEIVRRLERETSAALVFATTTPVIDERHQANKPFVRREADVRSTTARRRRSWGRRRSSGSTTCTAWW